MEPHNLNNNHESPPPSPPSSPPPPVPPPPTPSQSSPLPAPQHLTSPPMPQAEEPPQQYYYQPCMVMLPPLHFQAAAWVAPPGQHNVGPGMYGPAVQYNVPAPPAYEYNYPGYQRSWSTDLCDCSSDIRNCVVTGACPCLTFGQISEIINEGQTPCWEGCLLYGAVSIILGICSGGILTGVLGGFYRNKLREKYKLRGTVFNDFLVHALCEPCALCQEYRELGRFGFEVPLGWTENMAMQRAATAVYQVAPVIEHGMMR